MTVQKELSCQWVYLTLPLTIFFGVPLALRQGFPFLVFFFLVGVITKLDERLSQDWSNPTIEEVKELESMRGFRIVLYLSLILDWAGVLLVPTYLPNIPWYNLPVSMLLLAFLSSGSIVVTHELIHQGSFDQFFGTLHQIKNFYMHFPNEHLNGHHKRVATPEDPESADKGTSVYEFIPKAWLGEIKFAYALNPPLVIMYTTASTLFYMAIYSLYGIFACMVVLISQLGGVIILQIINYLEHYGLRRKRNPDGSYEKVTIRHSWNASHRFSNYLVYKLQRHSDHHQNSMKPYQTLCAYEDSPQLPHGYISCILMATFPKLWFEMMDPMVEEYKTASKGTHIKTMKLAEEKARNAMDYIFKVSLGLAIVELASHVLLL